MGLLSEIKGIRMKQAIRMVAWLIFGAALQTTAQPIIVSQPQDSAMVEGADAFFSVESSGISPIQYQWRIYSSASLFQNIPGATNVTLHLTNVPFSFKRFAVVV